MIFVFGYHSHYMSWNKSNKSDAWAYILRHCCWRKLYAGNFNTVFWIIHKYHDKHPNETVKIGFLYVLGSV